jgi:TPR repeat protein
MKKTFIVSIFIFLFISSVFSHAAAQGTVETSFARNMKKAAAGDADAQYFIGVMYDTGGEGAPKDPAKAREWYEKSAAQGRTTAMALLAKLYEDGEGVEQDYKKAFELYEKAAMLGEEIAQSAMGKLYFFGRGCEKSLVKSYAYATISESTDEAALESLKFLFDGKLSDAELKEAKELAQKLRADVEKNKEKAGKNK